MPYIYSKQILIALLWLISTSVFAYGEGDKSEQRHIAPLSPLDEDYLSQQVDTINNISERYLGRRVQGNRSDLSLLQSIINKRFIAKDNTQDLQALGAVLGNILKKDLKLSWRVYSDKRGRSRALCHGNQEPCLFPMTMLSRRIEVGISPNVEQIYDKATNIIKSEDPYTY